MISPNQFAALLLRVFALWLFFTAAQIGLLTYALQRGGQEAGAPSYAVAVLYLLGALLLWTFPLALAARILPRSAAVAPPQGGANGAASVAFISAGLLIIALKALTPVANYLSLLAMLVMSGQAGQLLSPSVHIDGVIGLAMLAIGMAMILKSGTLAGRALAGQR